MTVRKMKDRKGMVDGAVEAGKRLERLKAQGLGAAAGPAQVPAQVVLGAMTLVLPGAPVISVQFDPRPMMRRLVEGQARAQQLGAEVIVTLVEPIDVRIAPPPRLRPEVTPDLGGPDA